jgi:hypothetical protein
MAIMTHSLEYQEKATIEVPKEAVKQSAMPTGKLSDFFVNMGIAYYGSTVGVVKLIRNYVGSETKLDKYTNYIRKTKIGRAGSAIGVSAGFSTIGLIKYGYVAIMTQEIGHFSSLLRH